MRYKSHAANFPPSEKENAAINQILQTNQLGRQSRGKGLLNHKHPVWEVDKRHPDKKRFPSPPGGAGPVCWPPTGWLMGTTVQQILGRNESVQTLWALSKAVRFLLNGQIDSDSFCIFVGRYFHEKAVDTEGFYWSTTCFSFSLLTDKMSTWDKSKGPGKRSTRHAILWVNRGFKKHWRGHGRSQREEKQSWK